MRTSITIRPPETQTEVDDYFRLSVRTFWPSADPESKWEWLRRFVTEVPGFKQGDVLCAFAEGELAAGCVVHPRTLLAAPARLAAGCIALVATDTRRRGQGVARALLEHVIASAEEQEQALLILSGIPNFYHQFGFVDIFDDVEHLVDRQWILAQPETSYRVLPAAVEDAPDILALYRRHHERYTGSFARALDDQIYRIRFRGADNPIFLCRTTEGEACGYLLPDGANSHSAGEVVADSWPAALAMLQRHAQLAGISGEAPEAIVWRAPSDSPTLLHLLDNITFPRMDPLPPYPHWFVMRSQTRHLPLAGWMARPAHPRRLVEDLLPRWSLQLQSCRRGWPGTLALTIGEQTFLLSEHDGELRLGAASHGTASAVRLSQQLFTQLLFGFRPASWVAGRQGVEIPEAMLPVLEALFPYRGAWFAASDAF